MPQNWRRAYDGEAKAARAALESDKQVVDFCALFIDQDADDEEDSSLVEALTEFRAWAARTKVERKATGSTFSAADLALCISDTFTYPNPVRDAYRECFFPDPRTGPESVRVRSRQAAQKPGRRAGAWRWRNVNSQEPEVEPTGPCAGRLLGRGEGRSPGRCADFGGRWWRDSWRCRAVGGVGEG